MIKLSVDPNAVPRPKNAAIDDDAISFSRLCTVLQNKTNKNQINLLSNVNIEYRMYSDHLSYFGAQISAKLAK